jgi:hypothetical protein
MDLHDETQMMEILKNIRQDLWPEVSLRRKGLSMKKFFLP